MHLPLIAPITGLPLQALFQRSLLGQRGGIGVKDVEHPWMERLHDAQRLGRDCFIVLLRSNRLVPAHKHIECNELDMCYVQRTTSAMLSAPHV